MRPGQTRDRMQAVPSRGGLTPAWRAFWQWASKSFRKRVAETSLKTQDVPTTANGTPYSTARTRRVLIDPFDSRLICRRDRIGCLLPQITQTCYSRENHVFLTTAVW